MDFEEVLGILLTGLLMVAGVALIAAPICVYFVYGIPHFEGDEGNLWWNVAVLVIAGVLTIAAAIFGFLWLFYWDQEEWWPVLLAFILIAVAFVLELAFTALYPDTETSYQRHWDYLRDNIGLYAKEDDVTDGWDFVQNYFSCCGYLSYFEWFLAEILPESCCKTKGGCDVHSTFHEFSQNIHHLSCHFAVQNNLNDFRSNKTTFMLVVMLCQVFAAAYYLVMLTKMESFTYCECCQYDTDED